MLRPYKKRETKLCLVTTDQSAVVCKLMETIIRFQKENIFIENTQYGFRYKRSNLTNWANKWQMKFNVDKCKILHIGRNNDHVQYSMNGKYFLQ